MSNLPKKTGYKQCCGSRPLYIDPDPAFHFVMDPGLDPRFLIDTDPDPYRFKEVM